MKYSSRYSFSGCEQISERQWNWVFKFNSFQVLSYVEIIIFFFLNKWALNSPKSHKYFEKSQKQHKPSDTLNIPWWTG